jgi:DNA-binding beta-propeller fold protein YncE
MQMLALLMTVVGFARPSAELAAAAAPGYHVVRRIPIGGEGFWDYLTVDSASHRLFVTHGTHVEVIDVESGSKIGDISNTPGVHGVALAAELGKGFTSNGGDNTVTVFDLKTLKEEGRVAVGTRPDAILFDPATRRVFTFNAGSKDATAVDAVTGKVLGTVPLGGKPEFAQSDEHGKVFVNIEDTSEIAEIDAKNLRVLNRWAIAPGEEASGLAIDRKNHRLFAVCSNQKMAIVDFTTGKVVATTEIGRGPDAAAFDDSARLAFSSNGQDGTLTVIREVTPDKFEVAETIATAPGARTMALDSKSHRIYLVTARRKPVPAGEAAPRRPNFEPNSFEVIVVGR